MEISSTQLLLGWLLLIVVTCAVIFVIRFILNQRMSALRKMESHAKAKTALSDRTKYRGVNSFRYSGLLALVGLAISLCFSLMTISWVQHDRPLYTSAGPKWDKDGDTVIPPIRFAEQMPRFPGCENLEGTNAEKHACAERKLLEYIYANVKYPAIARENAIQGKVLVEFIVEKDGRISDVKIVRDIGGGCGNEVLNVVNEMNEMSETWTPGKQQGRPVRVVFSLPVSFRLK